MKKFVFIFLILVNSYSSASVVQYDENIDGDINIDTFNLGIGTNTISGNLTIGVNRDDDNFRFNIAAGEQLTSVIFAFSNITPNDNQSVMGLSFRMELIGPGAFVVPFESYTLFDNIGGPDTVTDSPINLFLGTLPAGEGFYSGIIGGEQVLNTTNPGGTLDYTITMGVSAVPVPAAVWLFSSALIGMIGIKRKSATVSAI